MFSVIENAVTKTFVGFAGPNLKLYTVYNAVLFQWDEIKREANRKKHGADFEDAVLVFDDPDYVLLDDRIDEWTGEQRFLAIGSAKTRSGQKSDSSRCSRIPRGNQ